MGIGVFKAEDSEQSRLCSEIRDIAMDFEEKLVDATKDLVKQSGQLVMNAKDRALNTAEELPELVRRYPMQSFLVAFGVGFIVAKALEQKDLLLPREQKAEPRSV